MAVSRAQARLARAASLLALSVGAGLMSAGAAAAQQAPPPAKPDFAATEVDAVIVTAAKGQASTVAPVASSLNAVEPQAVITRKFIEESAPRVGDFTTTAILAPSMATISNPNGPGSTDGSKLTLRGFQDGEYNVTYDGIAWGDTNGPSHHANSFFPSSTIGGIVIDRGPGQATALGQANFGGSVNLFSLPFEDHVGGGQTVTRGSFDTWQSVTTLTSGPIAQLHGANIVANFMEYSTDGYLSNSASEGQNQFIKITIPVTSKFRLTGLYTHNYDAYYQGDASSVATVAQTEAYGKRFALSNDPTLQTYYKYNATKKKTDFQYIRGDWDVGRGLALQNTVYSYAYNNRTLSGNNNGADATLGAPALTAANKVTLFPTGAYPAAGKAYTTGIVNGLPGYLKRNQYRVTGDVFQGVQDFGFGTLTAGFMYEAANTQRSRFDIDLLTRQPDYREKAATFAGPSACSLAGYATISAPGKTNNGACQVPLNTAYNEYSGWRQYQAFGQFEWRPIRGLTITPGVKYVNFNLFINAPVLAIKGSLQPSYQDFTYEKTLPFLTANYRVRPNLSVYGQYAQGFLVPNVSALYVLLPSKSPLKPQESTNYQTGVVYAAGDFTFDADLYYIEFKNKIQVLTDLASGESYQSNLGGATYKGVEVQGTYRLPHGFSVFANGSLNDARGKDDPTNPGYNGHQLAKAPFWTAATGLRFERRALFNGEDQLIATLNTKWIGQQYANAASGVTPPTALIPSWSETNLSATYRIGRYSIEGQLLNLFDTDDITAFKGSALIPGTNLPALTVAQGGGANTPTYQAGRSYQITLKAAF